MSTCVYWASGNRRCSRPAVPTPERRVQQLRIKPIGRRLTAVSTDCLKRLAVDRTTCVAQQLMQLAVVPEVQALRTIAKIGTGQCTLRPDGRAHLLAPQTGVEKTWASRISHGTLHVYSQEAASWSGRSDWKRNLRGVR